MTFHEDGARDAYNRWMSKTEGAAAVAEAYRSVTDGHLPDAYLDILGQTHRGPWPPEQILALGLIHAGLCSGRFAQVWIRTEGTPNRDADRDANAAAVADLPGPFVATVDPQQYNADDDGTLQWSEEIYADATFGKTRTTDDGRIQDISERIYVQPRKAPLEIGTTMPSRTMAHLQMEGCVARWPYGQDRITLLLNLEFPPLRWRPASDKQGVLF